VSNAIITEGQYITAYRNTCRGSFGGNLRRYPVGTGYWSGFVSGTNRALYR